MGFYGYGYGVLSKHCALACNEPVVTEVPCTSQALPPARAVLLVTNTRPEIMYPPPVAASPVLQVAVDEKGDVLSTSPKAS